MADNENRSLIPLPDGSLANTSAGVNRILSAMVGETLGLVFQEHTPIQSPSRKIGGYEWHEPDYMQILLWAKALALDPVEVIKRLLADNKPECPKRTATTFAGGTLLTLNWNFELLPLERFEWVEGLATTHLNFSGTPRKTPTLSLRLSSLTHLTIERSVQSTELDLLGVPRLRCLNCRNNQITELDLTGVPMLAELECLGNQLVELDVSALPMLTTLGCEGNRLTKLDLSAVPKLTALACGHNHLTGLDISGVPKLTKLRCGHNLLTALDLTGVPMLTELQCINNRLTRLDLSGVPILTHLVCMDNQLTELDIRPLFGLRHRPFYDSDSTRLIQRPDQHSLSFL